MTAPRLHGSQIAKAREMRARGWSWRKTADYLGVASETVKCALDPSHKAKVIEWRKAAAQKFREKHPPKIKNAVVKRRKANLSVAPGQMTASAFLSTQISIPPRVLADRDRRMQLEPASITAALMGDPPPGMSALDQRRPRIVVSNEENTA